MKRLALLVLCVLTVGEITAKLSIEPSRTIEFSIDEATWLSVDVSHDGETLILEVLGDLYTLPIAGGKAAPLSLGMAFESQPTYSPDGTFIAFISDRSGKENLWVMNSDGSDLRQLTFEDDRTLFASPSWSPSGDHIVVSKTSWSLNTYEIWAYHLEGGKGLRITQASVNDSTPRNSRHNAIGAVYSPDGKYLYFARKYGGFGYNLRLPIWQVIRRELKTNSEDQLTGTQGSAFRPLLSPDGRTLTYGTRFGSETGLRIRDLETGSDDWLVYPIQRDDQESRFTRDVLPGYTFTHDGKSVIYTHEGKLWRITIENREISEIPFQIDVKKEIGAQTYFPYRIGIGPVKSRLIRDAEMSPDKKRVICTAMADLYVYDISSDTATLLHTGEEFVAHPTWSTDGKSIAYVTWGENGGHIWRIRARKNQRPIQVTRHKAFYSNPMWLENQESIVAFRALSHERQIRGGDFGPALGTDIVRVNLQDRSTEIVRHSRGLTRLHRGPGNDRIYAYKFPGLFASGDSGIISFRTDGTDEREHLVLKGTGIYYDEGSVPATQVQISPDGRHFLVKHAEQLYLLAALQAELPRIDTTLKDSSLPLLPITDVGVDDFGWSHDSHSIYWTVGREMRIRHLLDIHFEDTRNSNSNNNSSEKTDNQKGNENVPIDDDPSITHFSIDIYHPRYEPDGKVALVGGTVVPMIGDTEAILDSATVVIDGDRIAAVGTDIEIPTDAHVIDVTGHYVLPGYVDTHAHIQLFRNVLAPDTWAFHANLAYGVTTAIDVQPSTVDIIEYEDLIKTGRVIGPKVLSTGPGIFSNNVFKSKRHAKHILTRYAKHYGVKNVKAYITGSREQRQWLLQAAQELSLMPTAEGALDTKMDLTHAIDGFSGNEHNLPVIGLFDDVAQLMARSRIAYTPTLLVAYGGPFAQNYYITRESPRHDAKLKRFIPPFILQSKLSRTSWAHDEEHVYQKHAEQALKIVRAGGRVGVGSHGELQGLGFHWELWSLASGGFTNYEALRAATRHGAEMIGIAQDVGTISSGKLADLVVLKNDPLEDLRATDDLVYVVVNGVVRNAETLDEVWPRSRKHPDPYWVNEHHP